MRKFIKRFGTDIAGYICLLLVIPVGWLPGPGGIPLLILSLSLLSVHNPWAKALLEYVRKHSDSLRHVFFPNARSIQIAWDVFAAVAFASAFAVSVMFDNTLLKMAGTALGAGSTTIFMFNRSRLDTLVKKAKSIRKVRDQ